MPACWSPCAAEWFLNELELLLLVDDARRLWVTRRITTVLGKDFVRPFPERVGAAFSPHERRAQLARDGRCVNAPGSSSRSRLGTHIMETPDTEI